MGQFDCEQRSIGHPWLLAVLSALTAGPIEMPGSRTTVCCLREAKI
jgi:hypothetical protein